MRIHIMGPNLFGTGTMETFHVHAEGCADVKRAPVYQGPDHKADRDNATEFATLTEIAEYVYDFEDNPADLVGDFRVFPCASELPYA
jgi:hypothetical protein